MVKFCPLKRAGICEQRIALVEQIVGAGIGLDRWAGTGECRIAATCDGGADVSSRRKDHPAIERRHNTAVAARRCASDDRCQGELRAGLLSVVELLNVPRGPKTFDVTERRQRDFEIESIAEVGVHEQIYQLSRRPGADIEHRAQGNRSAVGLGRILQAGDGYGDCCSRVEGRGSFVRVRRGAGGVRA